MRPIRVMHVVEAMNRGGVETWLMHVLRHTDRRRFCHDLLAQTNEPADYDPEAEQLGARVLRCPFPHHPLCYAKRFLQIVRQFGPFDVLHSHVHNYSGYVLMLGRLAGIPVRIVHGHSDTRILDSRAGFSRRLYLRASRRLIRWNCTHGLAVSEFAAEALFGSHWRSDSRFEVAYCGIDLSAFGRPVDSAAVRAEFGLSPQDIVFGHVGRFAPPKNHAFLMEIASHIVHMQPRAKFLLIGDGPLRSAIEQHALNVGLATKVTFAGARADVSRLIEGAMDACLFPSLHEGLPLALLEMQSAGLRCLVSTNVTPEAFPIPDLLEALPLEAGAAEWARRACRMLALPPYDRRKALDLMLSSNFDIVKRIGWLNRMYVAACARRP